MTDQSSSQNQTTQSSSPGTVDFSGLILGFSSAALYYLGESPLPSTEPDHGDHSGPNSHHKAAKNLSLARQNIDIIEIIKTKTKNNLTPEEERLLSQVLSDLKLKFIEASKG